MGVTLAARSWGRGPEPLVLLHGFTGSGAELDPLAPLLGERVSARALDLPGHGATPPPVGDPARGWDETIASIGASLGDRGAPVHLAGYSLGARLALAAALRFPERVRSLVLESGAAGIEDERERAARRAADEALAASIERDGVAAFVARWEENPVLAGLRALPEAERSALRARRLASSAAGLAWSLRALGQGSQPPLWGSLPGLLLPVLLIHGEGDARYAALAARMQSLLPSAQRQPIAGAGHTPHLERPAAFAAALAAFLAPRGRADSPTRSTRSTP